LVLTEEEQKIVKRAFSKYYTSIYKNIINVNRLINDNRKNY